MRHSARATSLLLFGLMLLIPCPAAAQGRGGAASPPSPVPSTDDKTATNPLNLQPIVAVSNHFASLADARFVDTVVYRYAMPFLHRRLSAGVELPLVASNITGRTEVAFGDLGARAVWIPWLADRRGVLSGVEATWNTATNDALGIGRHTLTPFVQVVFLPSARMILAPRYEQRVSAGGNEDRLDVNEAVLALYTVWLLSPTAWIGMEPEVVFDFDRERTNGSVAVEYGRLMFSGLGTFVRARLGLGHRGAKPFDWAVEFGFRIVP